MGRVTDFEQIRYYPGSSRQIQERTPVPSGGELLDTWDSHPRVYPVNGVDVEFFTSGDLAKALDGRSPVTIRKWESRGILPKATFHKPSDDPRGRRRLYTRAQVMGIVKIAKEEGIYSNISRQKVADTNFTQRVVALFKELRAS